MICVVVLPSLFVVQAVDGVLCILHDGEIHRRGDRIVYSRSPLYWICFIVVVQAVELSGRYTGEENYILTLVLPSVDCLFCFVFYKFCFQLSGRIHRVEFLVYNNSRSPLYEPKLLTFIGVSF